MKKVKIMLMSLALFAVVGGALAFKAKFNKQPMCTTLTTRYDGVTPTKTSCPVDTQWGFIDQGATIYYTTTQDAVDVCSFNDGTPVRKPLPCFNSTTLIAEAP
jgi:hypothetical protein